MAIRCPSCKGSKQIVGLGNVLKDCYECDGVGYIAEKQEPESDDKKVSSIKDRRERIKDPTNWKK